MKVIRDGISVIRQWAPIEDVESLQELADQLDDRKDGATILIALTPKEAEVIEEGLKCKQQGYGDPLGDIERIPLNEISAVDSALEEVRAAIRGVLVQK